MKWDALKNFKCPMCNEKLAPSSAFDSYHCTRCTFIIPKTRFDEVVSGRYSKPQFQTQEEKDSEFNNLGSREVTEDFSDSDALDY